MAEVSPVEENHTTPLKLEMAPQNKHHRILLLLGIAVIIVLTGVVAAALSGNRVAQKIIRVSIPQLLPKSQDAIKIMETSPENFQKDFPTVGEPRLVFNRQIQLDEKQISNYIKINPPIEGAWHVEKNKQVLYFSSNKKVELHLPSLFNYNTVYTITVSADLAGSDGTRLGSEKIIRFRTKRDPKAELIAEKKLINTMPDKSTQAAFTVGYLSSSKIHEKDTVEIRAETATREQVLDYFVYELGKDALYNWQSSGSEKEVLKMNAQLQKQSQWSSQLSVTIPPFKETGIYHVTVTHPAAREDFFIVSSNHIVQYFQQKEKPILWTADAKMGRALDGVEATAYTLEKNVQELSRSSSNTDGIIQQKLEKSADLIVTQKGTDTAFVYGRNFYDKYIKSTEPYSVYAYTDKPLYKPGDILHYKAIIRKFNNGTYALPETEIYSKLRIVWNGDNEDGYQKVTIDANGSYSADFQLPPVLNRRGETAVVLAVKKGDTYSEIDTHEVLVESYRKPDFQIEVKTQEEEYISKDIVHVQVTAKSLYGQPLSRVDFGYRVVVNDISEYKDRSVENPANFLDYYGAGKELARGSGTFDEKGFATFDFPTDLSNFELSEAAVIEITPKLGAVPAIGKTVKFIHRGTFAIVSGVINSDSKKGIQGQVEVLSHDRPRKSVAGQELQISLYKTKGDAGLPPELIETKTASSNDSGIVDFAFNAKDSGSYELVFQGKDSRENSVTLRNSAYISSPTLDQPTKQQHILTITKDKDELSPGETVEIHYSADFMVSDAVVVNAVAVRSAASVKKMALNAKEGVFQLRVPDNVIADWGVQVVSAYDGEVVRSEMQYKIKTESKNIQTEVSFSKPSARPGDTIQAAIVTRDSRGNPVSADTSLSVVDTSIYQVKKPLDTVKSALFETRYNALIPNYNSSDGILNGFQGGGGGCFLAGTLIRMADGSEKPIEAIVPFDKIKTFEAEQAHILVSDTVTKTFRHVVNEYITINKKMNVTPVHRIFINGRWKQASEATIGDILLTENGTEEHITSIVKHQGIFAVYNLTTDTTHTFFADGFYVHNEKGETPRFNFVDTAYWNPHIQTDSQGKATVSIKLPDNTTTFAAHAVSQSGTTLFGEGWNTFVTKKSVVITPALSTFYYENDKPNITFLIQNIDYKDTEFILKIFEKNSGVKIDKEITVDPGELKEISLPVKLQNIKNQLQFIIDLVNKNTHESADSVQVTRPVLPQGSIESTWQSAEGKQNFTFKPQFKDLDSNILSISLYPHAAAYLKGTNYISTEVNPTLGIELYSIGQILKMTEDGMLPPDTYQYAAFRNNWRQGMETVFDSVIHQDSTAYWSPISPSGDETYAKTTLAVLKALYESKDQAFLTQTSGIEQLTNAARAYIAKIPQEKDLEDQLLRWWVIQQKPDDEYKQEPEYAAAAVLNGEQDISALLAKRIPTADDRSVWITKTRYLRSLPMLAVVKKGSAKEADKVIRALSTIPEYHSSDSSKDLALLAAINHLVQNKYSFDKPELKILENNKEIVKSGDGLWGITAEFSPRNSNGEVAISVDSSNKLPFYSLITTSEYTTSQANSSLSIHTDTQGKVIGSTFNRRVRDQNGSVISSVDKGNAGIMELSVTAPVALQQNMTALGTFSLTDMVSPQYMILNQTDQSSPQYQEILKSIYPSPDGSRQGYFNISSYSDQIAYYTGNYAYQSLNMPYVFYNVSGGTHYQPKTSIVFPALGIILKEK